MKDYLIKNGSVYADHGFERASVGIFDGRLRIYRPEEADRKARGDVRVLDASGKRILPGFLDIHTHGAAGVDANGADTEGLQRISAFFAKNGTTSWLASILTDTKEQTLRCIDHYRELDQTKAEGAQLLGLHLEGPFLAKEYKGAMPEQLLTEPDARLAREYQERACGGIRYMTVSPELPGIPELIPKLRALGIVTALGHSGAGYEESMAAVRAGAAACTHTFNAMRLLHQHEPAILGAALETDLYCEMICDGRHLHPGIVRLLMKVKGPDRVVAVTDSIMAAGLADGNYRLGVNEIAVKDGDARLLDGTRAGSTLNQWQAFRNVLSYTGLPMEEVIPAFTENPARLIGVYDRKGSIEAGKDADLLIVDEKLRIEEVFLRGNRLIQYGSE